MKKIPIAKPYLNIEEQQAVIEVLESGWMSQGPQCLDFENKIASFLGMSYGRAVNSGTSAIHLALIACGIRQGDEVIVPAFTCVAALHPIESIGAKPVLVDIEIDTFNIDDRKVAQVITSKTKAIVVAHMFGLAASIDPIMDLALRHKLKVIEDNALGLGGRINHRYTGSFGDAACLSFHPRKMIATGEGGMVVTNSLEIANRIAQLRNYGASTPAWDRHKANLFELPIYNDIGYNYKLTDIQASIGLKQLNKLPEILSKRRQIAQRYNDELANLDWLKLPKEPVNKTHSYQSYVCLLQVSNFDDFDINKMQFIRDLFWQHLADFGISSVQGAQAMPTIDYYLRKYNWNPNTYLTSLIADKSSVALPIYPSLKEEEQTLVIEAIQSFKV